MAELLGTCLFLVGTALAAMKLEVDIEPWPQWGVFPAFGVLLIMIVILGAGVSVSYL